MCKTNKSKQKELDLSHLLKKWPSSIVAREKISDFTGGLISPGRIANLDSYGLGPAGKVRIGRKICYECEQLVKWLESRAKHID